ncbi:cdc42 effector protein 5 [Monodelphis domestica]|uniref:cdc42 effector protein 5 n=1 Tax=Monodelphis domestica TaxID=13616 RepID=UPI0024E1E49F|nr:cdc42 effector protein 5 [Monodelphis domestica]
MPILKQLGPAGPKKRLDRDAISAPLGDFRHTMHVGRGGDAFGDTSFLSRHGGGGPPGPSPSPSPAPSAAPSPARPPLAAPAAPQPPRPSDSQPESRSPAGDPFLSFHLDLGPSLLDEVLGAMDRGALAGAAPAPRAPSGGLLTAQPAFGSVEDLDEVIGL